MLQIEKVFPDFANFPREGYDYDVRMDEGLACYRDNVIMESFGGLSRASFEEIESARLLYIRS